MKSDEKSEEKLDVKSIDSNVAIHFGDYNYTQPTTSHVIITLKFTENTQGLCVTLLKSYNKTILAAIFRNLHVISFHNAYTLRKYL